MIADYINLTKFDGKVTMDSLFNQRYGLAYNTIQDLDAATKLDIAEKIEKHLEFLYNETKRFGTKADIVMNDVEHDLNHENYLKLMNKIKHWEQLLEWLYDYGFDLDLDTEL